MSAATPNGRFAVVIPTYNRAHLITRAIESALAQERLPDEVVVVDDGSSDETAELVRRFGSRVTYVPQEHAGVAAARNAGVAASDSEFIALLDSDDFWDSGHLARIEAAVEATDARAFLYFSDLRLSPTRDTGESIWDACDFHVSGSHEFRENGAEWTLLPRQPMMTPAAVVRRDAYQLVGGQAENLACREDTHFFLALGLTGPVCAVSGVAGEATGDDPKRLTEHHRVLESTYWRCTRWLYADILRRFPNLSRDQKEILRRRLADAHWQLGRMLLPGKPLRSAAHLLRATQSDRRFVLDRLRAWRT